jgi:hypothetical protein
MTFRILALRALAVAAMTLVQPVAASAQRVVNLPARDRALDGPPADVFRVGVEEGDPNEVFSTITGVGFDAAANLYILDRDNARIVVFDRSGKFMKTIGSKGQGPGEFTFPIGLAVFPDGSVAVMDLGNNGITIFGSNGEYADIVSPDPGLVQPRPNVPMLPTAGNAVLLPGSQIMGSPDTQPAVTDSLRIVRVGLDGSTRVLHRAYNKGPELTVSGSAGNRNVRMTAPPVYTPQVSWTGLPNGGIAVSPGLEYEVRLVSPSGAVSTVLRRPVQPRRIEDRDRELAREQLREQLETGAGMLRIEVENNRRSISAGGGGGMPRQEIERRLAEVQFAEQIPLVRRLATDPAGNIWVQKDGGPGVEDLPIDIIAASGEYRGTVDDIAMPSAFGPDGLVAFIESDDLGVQRVAVRRLPQGWR